MRERFGERGRACGDHGGECSAYRGRLRVRERLAGVPRFVRQIFYVHWVYIVIVLGLFAALCFGFAPELAGASGLGRFLSGFMAGFWLLRIVLQIFYYDRRDRRENRVSTRFIWCRWLCWWSFLGWQH